MLSAVFLLNRDATILIEKQYRDKIDRAQIDRACDAIRDRSQAPPGLIHIPEAETTLILNQTDDIWLVGACEGEEFALFALSVLKYLGTALASRLGRVTELTVKDKYTDVYQVLDYAVDFGFPLLNEPNTIQTLMNRPPLDLQRGVGRLQLDLERPWRATNVRYSSNEIFVDVVEEIDMTVNEHGRIDFCHIRGSVDVRSKLSGTPRCKLVLTGSSRYEDVTFHRSAEVEGTDQKVIPFVPPDGPFTLMRYRLTTSSCNAPVWIAPKFRWHRGGGVSWEIALRPEATLPKPLEFVQVRFQLPDGVGTPSLQEDFGKATWDMVTREVVWNVGTYAKKDAISLKGNATTESGFDLAGRFPVVTAMFATAGVSPSGFKIERLEIEGIEGKMFKGVKCIAKAGDYEFRSGLFS